MQQFGVSLRYCINRSFRNTYTQQISMLYAYLLHCNYDVRINNTKALFSGRVCFYAFTDYARADLLKKEN